MIAPWVVLGPGGLATPAHAQTTPARALAETAALGGPLGNR
jgi:hypothetical protein